jgi:hypothetical protein
LAIACTDEYADATPTRFADEAIFAAFRQRHAALCAIEAEFSPLFLRRVSLSFRFSSLPAVFHCTFTPSVSQMADAIIDTPIFAAIAPCHFAADFLHADYSFRFDASMPRLRCFVSFLPTRLPSSQPCRRRRRLRLPTLPGASSPRAPPAIISPPPCRCFDAAAVSCVLSFFRAGFSFFILARLAEVAKRRAGVRGA